MKRTKQQKNDYKLKNVTFYYRGMQYDQKWTQNICIETKKDSSGKQNNHKDTQNNYKDSNKSQNMTTSYKTKSKKCNMTTEVSNMTKKGKKLLQRDGKQLQTQNGYNWLCCSPICPQLWVILSYK